MAFCSGPLPSCAAESAFKWDGLLLHRSALRAATFASVGRVPKDLFRGSCSFQKHLQIPEVDWQVLPILAPPPSRRVLLFSSSLTTTAKSSAISSAGNGEPSARPVASFITSEAVPTRREHAKKERRLRCQCHHTDTFLIPLPTYQVTSSTGRHTTLAQRTQCPLLSDSRYQPSQSLSALVSSCSSGSRLSPSSLHMTSEQGDPAFGTSRSYAPGYVFRCAAMKASV